jgi:tetratricopeptide (TPR) repeat protein
LILTESFSLMAVAQDTVPLGPDGYVRRIEMLYRTAKGLIDLGDYEEAARNYEEALHLQERHKDRRGMGITLLAMGDLYLFFKADPRTAIGFYERSLAIKKEIKDRKTEPEPLHQMAYAHYVLDEVEQAERLYRDVLDLSRRVKNKRAEATALNGLGNCLLARGRVSEALDYYRQALPLRKKVGDRTGLANTMFNLGRAYMRLGDLMQARRFLEEALKRRRELLDVRAEAETLLTLGQIVAGLNDQRAAVDFYRQAIELARRVKNRRIEIEAYYGLGSLALKEGRSDEAIRSLSQALPLAEQMESPLRDVLLRRLIRMLASVYLSRGEGAQASRLYKRGLQLVWSAGDLSAQLEFITALGDVYAGHGHHQYALACYFQAQSWGEKNPALAASMIGDRMERLRQHLGEEAFARLAEDVRARLRSLLSEATGINAW